MIRKRKDLIGQRFGKLVVLKENGEKTIGHGKYPRTYQNWICKCDCGETTETTTQHLECNRTKSCGCLRKTDLTNKKFGILTPISYFTINRWNRPNTYWLCKCDCGKEIKVRAESLVIGDKVSCGCIDFKNPLLYSPRLIKRYYKTIKSDAARRHLEFNIIIEDLENLMIKQNSICALSGNSISIDSSNSSLDRIDNQIGYVIDNIQWVYRPINYMKNTLSNDDFIKLCHDVSSYKNLSH